MPICDIIDWRCIFVNEIVGSTVLTILFAALFYFIVAGKLRWGFDTTMATMLPVVLIFGLMIAGFSAILAFSTVIIGIMLSFGFNKIIQNR